MCAQHLPHTPATNTHQTRSAHSTAQMCHSQVQSLVTRGAARANPRRQAHGVCAAWAVRTTVQDAHPRHTARHATRHHGPLTHMQQHTHVIIYGCAQEASDGTRQGSSPPRRVLCVSCGEAISLLRSQPASPEQCARHAPWGPHHAARAARGAASSPLHCGAAHSPGTGLQKVARRDRQKNPTRQTTELLSKVAKQHFPHVSVMHTVGTRNQEAGPRWGPAAWSQTTT